MYKHILLSDKVHFLPTDLFVQDEMFSFSLTAMKNFECSHWDFFWVSQVIIYWSTSPTRSKLPSHATSSTPHHTRSPSWRIFGCSFLRQNQYSYVDYGPPTFPCPSTINQKPLVQLNGLRPFQFTLPPSATLPTTRSTSPSLATSSTPLHTRSYCWRNIGWAILLLWLRPPHLPAPQHV